MPYYLSKVLPLLLLPVSLALLSALLALAFILKRKRIASIVCVLTSTLVLFIFALPWVAMQLLWSLERQYPPVAIENIGTKDCIVVLGGALGLPIYPRVNIELTDGSDRIYQTAKLYRNGKGRIVIVAAGNQPGNQEQVPESVLIGELLVEWGVPRASIVLDSDSKNTHENAINAANLLSENGCRSNLLVTSAWHMPRAVASFNRAGVDVFPFSVDIRAVQGDADLLAGLIPRADALTDSSLAIKEWMGIWVYRWRGWN